MPSLLLVPKMGEALRTLHSFSQKNLKVYFIDYAITVVLSPPLFPSVLHPPPTSIPPL